MIGQLAIKSLPAEIPAFLRTSGTATYIGELAREPDRSRGSGNSHDHDLDPGHYINLTDQFEVLGGVNLDPLPTTREDYDTALRLKGSNEYKAGFLPYAIVDGWQQLQKDFAYWRADVAGEKSAKTPKDRAWYGKDRRLRELLILRDLGYWSHFVADASQPMHVSVHHDTWGDFPNPQAYAAKKGFHSQFEGTFVATQVLPDEVLSAIRPFVDCACSIQERTLAYLRETHRQVDKTFELEKTGAFADPTPAGKEFVTIRLAAAVSELRDMIVAAWRGSADAVVGYPPVALRDVESGRTNPLKQMQGLD